MIPLWAIFGFSVAALSALGMLLQERLKVDGLALAFWCKVSCVLATLPFILSNGLPTNPLFYLFLGLSGLIFAVSDVIFFRNLPKIGAGVVSRLLPSTIFPSFLLWFAVDPALISKYMAQPIISALILCSFLLATYFSMRLKKCTVSMQAVRLLWFVVFANVVGPVIAKLTTTYASIEQGPVAYTFVQACMMIAMWCAYMLVARPIPVAVLCSRHNMGMGLLIGFGMAATVVLNVMGLYHVDNPGYMTALRLTDSVMILLAHKAMGKKDGSNIGAGLGIVISAVALIILKSQI